MPAQCTSSTIAGSRPEVCSSSRIRTRSPARRRPPWRSRSRGEIRSREVDDLLAQRLKQLGLRDVDRVLTHTNRTVMVSLTARRVLRLHRGYAAAPDRVLRAIVRFLDPRLRRALRRGAEREFLAFPVERYAPPPARPPRCDRPQPGDLMLLHRLEQLHGRLNLDYFAGSLSMLPIRVSGRMRTRLG